MNAQESILIATLGGQPQVLTFALDYLLDRGESVGEVIALHVASADGRVQRALALLSHEFSDDTYRGRPCRFRRHPVREGTLPVVAIDDGRAAEATWQTVHQLIAGLKAERRHLHLCITGGPRMIGLLAMSAATFHFDHRDRLWHLYTPRDFQEKARDGAILHAGANDGVTLIEVPMAPWGAYFPALRSLMLATSDQVIATQTRWLDRVERAQCEEVVKQLTPRQSDVLQAFAAGLSPQEVADRLVITVKTVDAHKTVILDECRNAWDLPQNEWLTYHFLRDKFERYFTDIPAILP